MKLLFCDSFTHDGELREQVDSITFPSPVVVECIRIVPNRQKAHQTLDITG